MKRTIADRLFSGDINVEKYAVIDENSSITYGEFRNIILRYGQYLLSRGIQSNDNVVVECTQDIRYLAIDIALGLIGAVFVPTEMNVSDTRLSDILEETDAKLYISRSDVISIDDYEESWEGLKFPDEEENAEILYTTGTTGKSKGIVLTHANNYALAENIIDGTKMHIDNVELIPLPISHSHGLRTCYANLLNGSTVVLVNGVMRVKKWIELMKSNKVTSLDLSPTAARALLKVSRGNLDEYKGKLDYVEIGTAALDEELKNELCEVLPYTRLYNFYGSTESGRVCVLDFNNERGLKNCIGYPTKNAKFIVTDEDRNVIKSTEDEMGLLAIEGPMNMQGYYRAADLTSKTLKEGFVYTNDIGYIDDIGRVFVVGRKGSVINYLGIKIAPEEIETIALGCDLIKDCACVPANDNNGLEVPKLYVVLVNYEEDSIQKIREYLRISLESNKLPQIIESIDEIPRANNGKILRNKLIEK